MKERLKEFIRYKKISTSAFEKASGMSNGYINAMKGCLGAIKLENVLKAFPEINREWLVYGEGEMIATSSSNSSSASINIGSNVDSPGAKVNTNIDNVGKDFLAMLKEQQRQNAEAQRQNASMQDMMDRMLKIMEKK